MWILVMWLAAINPADVPPMMVRTSHSAVECGEWVGMYEAYNAHIKGAPYRFKCQKAPA